jgi:hypothetical protein
MQEVLASTPGKQEQLILGPSTRDTLVATNTKQWKWLKPLVRGPGLCI